MTDSEKLDDISKRIKRIEIKSWIHLTVVILGFIGVVSLGDALRKMKK